MIDLGIDGLADVSLIGKGGTASVYKASNRDGETVAVKIFPGVWDDDRQRRFKRELEAMEKLNQVDGVVKLYDQGRTSNGVAYFTMPFYTNGSLQDALTQNGPYDWEKAISYVRQVLSILKETHALGIYHRDLKPANILLDDVGSPVIADFGITEIADGRSVSTMAAYTPGFCPPEALTKGRKNINGAPCDIYALGSTLWSLLTAKQPFMDEGDQGTDPMVLLNRLTKEPLPEVHSAPAWINNVIAFATAKIPDQRYASLVDVLHDLDNEGAAAKSQIEILADTVESHKTGLPLTIPRLDTADRTETTENPNEGFSQTQRIAAKKVYLLSGAAAVVLLLTTTILWLKFTADSETASSKNEATENSTQQPASPETANQATSVDTTISDSALLKKAELVLPKGVNVSANQGIITLTGVTDTEAAKNAAASQVQAIEGIDAVNNQIIVDTPETAITTIAPTTAQMTTVESAPTTKEEIVTTQTTRKTGSFAITQSPQSEVLAIPGLPALDIYFAATVQTGGALSATTTGACSQPVIEEVPSGQTDFRVNVFVGVCKISIYQKETATFSAAPPQHLTITGTEDF